MEGLIVVDRVVFIRRTKMSVCEPLNDRVVVMPIEESGVTPGGIVLPDTAKEKPTSGKVIAVGPGRPFGIHEKSGKTDRHEISVRPGDVVLYNKYAGTVVELNGVEHTVLREDDILVKLRD